MICSTTYMSVFQTECCIVNAYNTAHSMCTLYNKVLSVQQVDICQIVVPRQPHGTCCVVYSMRSAVAVCNIL